MNAARSTANAKQSEAAGKVDNLMAEYNRFNGECSWKRVSQCVAASATWVQVKAAQGVLDIAAQVADAVLR
jgi:hypothetical protein